MSTKNSGIWNAFLRIYIGIYFLYAVHFKLNSIFFADMRGRLLYFANHDPLRFYSMFLHHVAVPNAFLFAALVVMGELFVGVFLTVGFITRIAGLVGLFLNLNYLLAMFRIGRPEFALNLTFIICELLIIFTDSGKVLGMDAIF